MPGRTIWQLNSPIHKVNQSKKNRHKLCDDLDALAEFITRPQVELKSAIIKIKVFTIKSQIKIISNIDFFTGLAIWSKYIKFYFVFFGADRVKLFGH